LNFLLDHDVPAEVARVLLRDQHEVSKVKDILPVNSSDEKVFAEAIRQDCVLITCNRDDFLQLART
jgi:predicted nuclease of predicted toxin-antitoxin system